jgi:hypothetical protein
MPPSRPISPTEQLNMLSWLDTEVSRRTPEPKKEEVEVILSPSSSTIRILFSSSDIGTISPKVCNHA